MLALDFNDSRVDVPKRDGCTIVFEVKEEIPVNTKGKGGKLWCFGLPILTLAACIFAASLAQAQMTSAGIDCSQIGALHLLEQENLRAGLILMECGIIPRPAAVGSGDGVTGDEPQPPNVLVSNRSCSAASTCTKSESMVWHSAKAGDNTIVVNYIDDVGTKYYSSYSGTSFSTDGGATFTEILPPPFDTGHGTNYGDPIVVYNLKLGQWFAGDLVTGCGSLGIGLWTSPDGQNWTAGVCAHSSNDDRESMWVDNNPFSARYGRMYISFNDHNVGGELFVTYSDDGVSWSTPVQLSSSFIRDVQLTGTPPGPAPPQAGHISTVFVAAMDEGGGGLNSRQNIIYRSLDGGLAWSSVTMGTRFSPPGDGLCSANSYFAQMNPIWRYMGWGEPGVGPNGVIHYAYAGQGAISTGDILYTRSTDNGNTWSTPIVLNDPETNQYQSHWMPSLSVSYNPSGFLQTGKVTVSWYDRRAATSACNVPTDPGCSYQRYGVQSADNGVTWGANFAVSDVLIPQPTQSDPQIMNCYAGDYDYSTALGSNAFVTWNDGRVAVGGVQVQNVEFAAVPEP